MKISVLLCLAVLVLTVPQLYSYNTKRDIQGGAGEELMLDNSNDDECCRQNGTDVDMLKPGSLEVVLDGELVFEVCSMNCDGDFLVCYEGDAPNPNGTDLCGTKCGFYVSTRAGKISVMEPITSNILARPKMDECESFVMVNGQVLSRFKEFTSCSPKIENGLVKLSILNASSDCVISIKNATVKPETTIALPTTSTTATAGISTEFKTKSGPSGNETETTAAPGGFFEDYWWIFLIIVIFVVALVAAGIVVYCLKCKKPKKPTPAQQPAALRMPPGPQSPVVLQTSAENVKSRGLPSSILNPSSILSHKSLLGLAKKEEVNQEETDLASLKPTA